MPTIRRIHNTGLDVSFGTTDIGLDADIGSFIRSYSLVGIVKVEDRKITAMTNDGEFLTSFSWSG